MQLFRQQNDEVRHNDLESQHEDLSPNLKARAKNHSQPDQSSAEELYESESPKKKLRIRLTIFSVCLLILFVGRFYIPDEKTYVCIDRLQAFFYGANDWINANPFWRNTLQIICSLFMDIMFIGTGINWIIRGGSSRLIVTTISFYILRAMVQAIWVSPFPDKGYWWNNPGLPSLVVPYGEGTDFFFSGHIGFVTICAMEWKVNGHKLIPRILAVGGVYTGFILLIYKVHYSIDLFTGVTFAHWLFMMIDQRKEKIDAFFVWVYYVSGKSLVKKLYSPSKDTQDSGQHLYNFGV